MNSLYFFGHKTSPIGSILLAQLIVTCAITLILLPIGENLAMSALVGGFICLLPNAYSARRLTARRTANVIELSKTIFAAELGKIVITATLFALVFSTQEWIKPEALLGGFILAQLTHWITPLWGYSRYKHK